ncbi:hypothetical protein ID866_5526 [Astraeus odoratus]|nr:hypothetical protein ID866_5526 [Astraeus odoratus]
MVQANVHQLFRRLETVGKGAYGSVHKGIHVPSGNIVALKIINLDTADDDVEAIQREVALLTQLRDAPNVTKYYGCYLDGPRVWIAMEFAQGGSVRTLMQTLTDGVLEERFIVVIIREVLVGLSYLHKSAIIHRDIKAANILITAAGKVMICDFGVSALSASTTSKRNTLMGTPNWMAPEVAQPTPVYDSKADIWSLGILVYEMAKGAPPHSDLRDAIKVMQLITRAKPPRLGDGDGSKDMRDFVFHCLRESPQDRLTADELAKTKWIKSASKVNVSILKELIHKYETWAQKGGLRVSLAEPLDWENDEKRDLERIMEQDEELWEFDTIKNQIIISSTAEDDVHLSPDAGDQSEIASTVRPTATRLPTSLRALFDDESFLSGPQEDTLGSIPSVPVSSPPAIGRSAQRKPTHDFQFPSPSSAAIKKTPSIPTHNPNLKTHDEVSPTQSPPSGELVARKPSLHRQSSVAVMESIPTSPLIPPIKPFVARERSSSSSSNASTISLPNPRSNSPSRPDCHTKARSSHSASRSLTSETSVSTFIGPTVRPLDFSSLVGSHEATNAHLARTVDDLTKWLAVVEVGFATFLDQPDKDTTTEKQDEPSVGFTYLSSYN